MIYGLLRRGHFFCHSFSLFLSLSFSLFSLSRDRPGGGRGSRREPLADCSRAQWTVNGKRTVYNIVMIQ